MLGILSEQLDGFFIIQLMGNAKLTEMAIRDMNQKWL